MTDEKVTLFQLDQMRNNIESLLATHPEDTQLLTELHKIEGKEADKCERYAYVILRMKANEKELRSLARQIEQRAQSVERDRRRLEAVVAAVFEANDWQRVRGDVVTAWRTPGATSVKLECEPAELPPQFQRTKIEADRKGIKRALEKGEAIAGALLVTGPDSIVCRIGPDVDGEPAETEE